HANVWLAVRRVGLEEEAIGGALLDDFAQRVPARPGDEACERQVEAQIQESLSPIPFESEVMHRSPQARMRFDRGGDFIGGAAVVDRYRQVQLHREREQLFESGLLYVVRRAVVVHEVEADLAD